MNTLYEIDDNQYDSASPGSFFGWLKRPACVILFVFILGAMTLTGPGQQRALGILLVATFVSSIIVHSFRSISPMPPEIKMYIIWVIWAGLTGLVVAKYKITLWHGGLRQVLQVLALVIAVYSIGRIHRDHALKALMFGVIAGGLLQGFVVRSTLKGYGETLSTLESNVERATGLTDNANMLGFLMIWTMLALFMLWKQKRAKTHIIISVVTCLLIPLLSYGVLASGSRKSLVGFAFVIAFWLWYAMAPLDRTKSAAWKMGLIAAGIALSGPLSAYVLTSTLAGKRMIEKMTGGETVVSAEFTRYEMYVEGLQMTATHPVFGVGVNQYRHYSQFGKYSHSNYIEPLATTGIPGFILFQGIFFIPVIRAWRLTKIIEDKRQIYQLKVLIVVCVTILLIGFGSPWYTSTTVMSLLALFSGYTHSCLQQVRYEQWSQYQQLSWPVEEGEQ